jgi:hypothetical protein
MTKPFHGFFKIDIKQFIEKRSDIIQFKKKFLSLNKSTNVHEYIHIHIHIFIAI